MAAHLIDPSDPVDPSQTKQSSIGYRERSLWVSLAAVALVDTLYFAVVLYAWQAGEALSAGALMGLLALIVALLICIECAFLLANRAQREPMDERDQSIAASSARAAYIVFAACVVLALSLHLLNARSAVGPLFGMTFFDVPLVEVHLLLAGLVSAELVRYATALVRYRNGR